MKTTWCWRCKMNLPMLDDDEWAVVWAAMNQARSQDDDRRKIRLIEYNRITGFNETNINAIFHHRISLYGPPCPRCHKHLRTNVTSKCYECGLQLRPSNWAHLFTVTEAPTAGEGDRFTITTDHVAANSIAPDDQIDFRNPILSVVIATVLSVKPLTSTPTMPRIALRMKSKDRHSQIKPGFEAWLIHSPRWKKSPTET